MRYREGLYWIVIGTALISAIYLYRENHKAQNALQRLSAEKEVSALRISADEYFIAGQADSAFTLYRRIDTLTGDSLTHRRAEQLTPVPDTGLYLATIHRLTGQLSLMNASLIACRNAFAALSRAMRQDSLPMPSPACPEIPLLQAKLDSLQSMLATAQKRGFLEFNSPKNGYKIIYFGEIADSMANGYGVGYWTSGSIYRGYWKDNRRHGQGTFEWADGERYEGEYREDKRHGYGIYISKVGRYEGYWEEDMRHGEGRLYEAGGKLRVHGIWERDKLQKILK